jgi:hypothetical protein
VVFFGGHTYGYHILVRRYTHHPPYLILVDIESSVFHTPLKRPPNGRVEAWQRQGPVVSLCLLGLATQRPCLGCPADSLSQLSADPSQWRLWTLQGGQHIRSCGALKGPPASASARERGQVCVDVGPFVVAHARGLRQARGAGPCTAERDLDPQVIHERTSEPGDTSM